MLYVFHGTNVNKVADRAHALVQGLLEKREGAQVFMFDSGNFVSGDVASLIDSSGLFVQKHIITLRGVFEVAECREFVLERLAQFSSSENIVVLIEGKLLAEQKRAIEKHAHKVEEYVLQKDKTNAFNVFALGNAFSARDRRGLWFGYVQARRAGLAPENIHGALHWTVRGLLAVHGATTAEEVGQKSPVFNRNKQSAQNYTQDELVSHSRSLIRMYHDAHRGKGDLDISLERWCLSI
jgi:DNA polymerase III delta subunit